MTLPTTGDDPAEEVGRWLAACGEVAAVLAGARGLESSGPEILRVLEATLGWDGSVLWLSVPDARGLRAACASGVRASSSAAAGPGLAEGALLLARRALATRRPSTPEDLDPRDAAEHGAARAAAGLRGALAIPLVHGTLAHGAVELVRREPFALDEAGRRAAELIGAVLGQFASREETMAALHRTKRELAEVFEEAPVGIVVMDADRRILRVNRTGLSVLRTARGALAGRAWADLFEDRAVADRIWERVEACRTPGEVVTEDARARAGDGALLWLRMSMNAGWSEEGRLLRVRGFFRDIGSKVEAETSRRRSEERYLRLATAARDYALHALDGAGAVTSWNVGAERVYGWREEDVLGRDFAVSFTPEDRADDVPHRMLRLAVDEGEFHHEGWRVRQDGSRFWALVVYTAIRDGQGNLIEISQLTRDATQDRRLDAFRRRSEDLARANREVLRAARRKEELLGHVLGALRGPLRDVHGAAGRLSEAGAAASTPETAALLARVEALDRAVAAIEDLLAPGSPDVEMHPEPLDLARLATEAREVLRTAAAERQVRVDVDVDAAAGEVKADRQMVRVILHNLLSNAVKFSRERSRVHVRVAPEGPERVRLEVEDAGIGLTEEEAARLLGPAPAAREESAPGLGLAATRRIVEQMGGRLGVQSTPGRGSVFFVVLPREPLSAPAPGAERAAAQRLAGPVLVVSEDPSTRASLCWTLGSVGLEVVPTARAEEALDACRERRFEAVAVDLALGGEGAVDLVATIRAEGASREVPWVIPCVGTREAGAAGLPVADLLPRPAPADRLFAALERVRAGRSRGAEVLLIEGDPDVRRGVARTLEVLTYRVRAEVDGNAALRACAERAPAAILLGTSVRGLDPFTFLHDLRQARETRDVPVLLMASRAADADEERALRSSAVAAARDGLWVRSL